MGTTRRWCLLLGLVLALSLSSACEDSAGVAILDQSDGSEELDTTEEQTELSDLEELEDVDGTEQTEPDTDLIEDVELEEDNDFPDFDVPDEEEQLQPCSRDADCEEGQLCRFIIENGELSLGCAWPLGPRAPGEACSADDQCAHGACIGNICARPCLSDNDCAVGYVCESRPFASTTVDICVPEPVVCAANADCAEAQLCVVDRSGSELLLLCGEAVGPGTLGTSCSSDAECEANLCVAGQCTAPCERHADCADDGSWQCEELELEHGGGSSLLEVCQPTPATVCLSDGMCLLPERCVASKQNSSVSWTCQAPVGPAEAGESCAFDAACVSNLCANGRCMAPCAASADCPSDYTCNKLSVDVPAGRTEVSVCIPPVYCQDNAVCLTSEVCYAQRKPDDISLTCHTPNVGGDLGVGCNTDGQCRMNLCIPGRFGDYCSRACDQNADCGAGFHCGSEELETLSGSTVTLSHCQRDNAVPCQSRSDCGTGTVC
ncbi:MAG: hypothetical protein RBU37_11940, partial [Myxococcota bacterium]|nr:hypothetical protein [Myxococcota bacterium]